MNIQVTPLGYGGALTIPSSVTYQNKTYAVTKISNYAFCLCSNFTSVTIPNSVTSIGAYAFRSCTGLTRITIGNAVTSIGYACFNGCKSLTSIAIPSSVTELGKYAFAACTGLTSIAIPNSVTSISDYAFSACTSLTSIMTKIASPKTVIYYYTDDASNHFISIPATSTLYVPEGTIESYQLEQYNNKPNPWLAFGTMSEIIDGDVDLDGKVTSADVTAIYNCILNNDIEHHATCDINGDGNITAANITALYNIILN